MLTNSASHGTGPTGSTWIPDSGVNFHVTGNSKSTGLGLSQPSAMLTNSASHGTGPTGSTWILDSGVSFHVTGNSQNIK